MILMGAMDLYGLAMLAAMRLTHNRLPLAATLVTIAVGVASIGLSLTQLLNYAGWPGAVLKRRHKPNSHRRRKGSG